MCFANCTVVSRSAESSDVKSEATHAVAPSTSPSHNLLRTSSAENRHSGEYHITASIETRNEGKSLTCM